MSFLTDSSLICRFERDVSLQNAIIDSLLRVQESDVIRSRERSSNAENRRWATTTTTTETKNLHTDTKVKKIAVTARQQAFENSTVRQLSQFERVQMKTTMSDEMMNSKTVLAVHRADSASGRRRRRDRERERSRERRRERKRREREQAVSG